MSGSLGSDVLSLASYDFTKTPQPAGARTLPEPSGEALQSLLASVKKQIAFFEQTTVGYKTLIESLLARLKEKQAHERDLSSASIADHDRVSALQNEKVELERQLQRVNESERLARERASTEASNLRLQVMQLKEELDEAKRAAAAAHTELGQLKSASRAASLSSLGSADTATRIAKLETELSAERADLLATRAQLARVTAELIKSGDGSGTTDALARAKAQLADQHRQNAELRALTDKYNGEISEASRTVAALKDTNKRLQQDLRDAVAAQYKSEEARRSEEAKAEKLRDEMATFLKSSREHSARQLEAAATAVPVSSSSPVVLDGPAEWQKMGDAEMRKRVHALASDLNSAKRDLAERERESERLRSQLEAAQSSAASKDRTIASLTVQLSEAVTTHVHSDGGISNKLDSLEMKQNKLDRDMEMMEENLMLSAAVAEKDEQLAALRAQLAKLTAGK